MKRPNFFFVGAPKCGTSAMHAYLRAHPNIFMPRLKEPNYFVDHIPDENRIHSLDVYLDLFRGARQNHVAVGEASVFYLVSEVAARRIREFDPNARLIVMLRNPVDMIHSFHAQLVYSGDEDEKNFEKAWRKQRDRANGIGLPRYCFDPLRLQYAKMGMLGEQVARLLNVFDRKQVKLIVFDDLKKSTKCVYEDVLKFLSVPSDGRVDFPRVNENTVVRSERVDQFIRHLPGPLDRARARVKSMLRIRHPSLGYMLIQLNTRKKKRPPLRYEMRQELIETFGADVQRLGRLLDRDLNHWTSDAVQESHLG